MTDLNKLLDAINEDIANGRLVKREDVLATELERDRLRVRAETAEARLRKIASVAVLRGRCIWCAHPDDPADGQHTDTCLMAEARALLSTIDDTPEAEEQ